MHEHELTMVEGEKSDPKASTTWIVATMSVGLLITIVLLIEAFFHATAANESDRKKFDYVNPQLKAIQTEQLQQLEEYRVLDEASGRVSIPIDEAIRQVVAEGN